MERPSVTEHVRGSPHIFGELTSQSAPSLPRPTNQRHPRATTRRLINIEGFYCPHGYIRSPSSQYLGLGPGLPTSPCEVPAKSCEVPAKIQSDDFSEDPERRLQSDDFSEDPERRLQSDDFRVKTQTPERSPSHPVKSPLRSPRLERSSSVKFQVTAQV